ncbi:NTPase KAP [Burkholderia cepacia]|uniref:NTPase KAP n=1 Tax=Burkholderia cepacia TaxID=292 RepID=UPI0029903AF5|nr:NTPase KAP [Burkholderia cepacia]
MTLKDTREHLIAALGDRENRVVAMSGKWGTGKSHLWRDIKDNSGDEDIARAVYVSMFGVSDINQLLLKALRAAVPVAADDSAWAERIRKIALAGSKIMQGFHRGFGALEELALLAAPQFLHGRIVVVDDIERKHPKLSVDEILGFIDELTQQHDARFLLILNDDKLDDAAKHAWATLREKVIDQEVRLITTPEESFEIAQAQTRTRDDFASRTKAVVDMLGVDNIRVIRRIIRAVNRILAERALKPEVLDRTIPSIALLSTIHYHGMDDAPDFDFVLNAGSFDHARDEVEWDDEKGSKDEIAARRAKWRELLRELGIMSCDEFEELVIAFLKDGQFDASGVTNILDRYQREADQLLAQQTGQALSRRLYWDIDSSDQRLVDEARNAIPHAKYWDAYLVTILVNELAQLPGGPEVGEAFVQAWIDEFRTREKTGRDADEDLSELHPAIAAEIRADVRHVAETANASLLEVVRRIVKQSGWGATEEFAMKNATALDFESTIRQSGMDDRAFFLKHMIRMRNERRNYDPHFGNATERFVNACQSILSAPDTDRLARLIRRVVTGTPLGRELGVVDPAAQPAARPAEEEGPKPA